MRRASATIATLFILLATPLLAADPARASDSGMQEAKAEQFKQQLTLYQTVARLSRIHYDAFAAKPGAELRKEACQRHATSLAEGKELRSLLKQLPADRAVALEPIVAPVDGDVANIGTELTLAGGCTGGVIRLAGVGRSLTAPAPRNNPPADPVVGSPPNPGVGPGGSTHRVVPLYLSWTEVDGAVTFELRDGNDREVEIRPSLYRDYLSGVTGQTAAPVLGNPAPETVAGDIEKVLGYLASTPDAFQKSYLPLFTTTEGRILAESMVSTPALDPAVARTFRGALGAAEASRRTALPSGSATNFESFDRERSVAEWLRLYKGNHADANSYERLLKGQRLDLEIERNGREMLLQIRPGTRVESASDGRLYIGDRAFKTDELRYMTVPQRSD